MFCGISFLFVLSALFSCYGKVLSNSEVNTTLDDADPCMSKIIQGFTPNSLQMLKQGHLGGLKVTWYLSQQNHGSTDWLLVREDGIQSIFFSLSLFNPMAHWVFFASFQRSKLSILENPRNCLGDYRHPDFLAIIQQLILQHIHDHTLGVFYLCVKDVKNISGNPVELFDCCTKSSNGTLSCEEIQTGGIVKVFFSIVFVLKVLLLLFAARFIPTSLYRKRHCYKEFIFSLTTPLEIAITKRFSPPPNVSKLRNVELGTKYMSCGYQYRIKIGENLNRLSDIVERMEMSKTENFKLRAVWFKVDPDRLVSRNKAPVGLFSFLYRRLFQCKCYVHGRKQKVFEHSYVDENSEYVSLHNCCKRKISKDNTWESLVRKLMQMVFTLFVFWSPVIVITMYWNYEKEFIQNKLDTARNINMTTSLPFYSAKLASLFYIHGFYAVYQLCFAIWFLPLLMLIIMKVITDNTFWKRTVWIFLRSLEYSKHFSRVGNSWAASFLLRSFTSSALTDVNSIHIFLWIIVKLASLLVIMIVLLFCKLSGLNMFLQLLWRYARELVRCVKNANDDDKHSDTEDLVQEKLSKDTCEKNVREFLNLPSFDVCSVVMDDTKFPRSSGARFSWCVMCLGWLTFLICAIPILVDVTFIIVDVLILAVVCLIANFRYLAQYFVIILFICVYSTIFIKRVEQIYQNFNNRVQTFLLERQTRSLINKDLHDDTIPGANRCYQVIPARGCERCAACHVFTTRQGLPMWKARHLVQFVDDKGEPSIPKNFFFQTCYINHFACPGSLSNHYYNAMIKSFLLSVCLLVMVLLVKIVYPALPWWGHLLVYTILGLAPIICLTSFPSGSQHDKFDVADDIFKQKLEQVIREYKQEWSVIDLEISSRVRLDDSISSHLEGNDDANNETKCWFRTPSNVCVCLNVPNRKSMNGKQIQKTNFNK
jgi:hypothetical protein